MVSLVITVKTLVLTLQAAQPWFYLLIELKYHNYFDNDKNATKGVLLKIER